MRAIFSQSFTDSSPTSTLIRVNLDWRSRCVRVHPGMVQSAVNVLTIILLFRFWLRFLGVIWQTSSIRKATRRRYSFPMKCWRIHTWRHRVQYVDCFIQVVPTDSANLSAVTDDSNNILSTLFAITNQQATRTLLE